MAAPITAEDVRRTREMAQKFSALCTADQLLAKKFVYIDADLLFDFKLGVILSNIRGEKMYNAVLSHLDEYLDSDTLECARFFPEVGMKEEDILAYLADSSHDTSLSVIVPETKTMSDLMAFVDDLRRENAAKGASEPITFYINQRLHNLLPRQRKHLEDSILRIMPYAIVKYTEYRTWHEVPREVMEGLDFIGVYDIIDLLRPENESARMLLGIKDFSGTTIVALKQADHEIPADQREDVYKNTAAVLNLMCDNMYFIRKSISGYDPKTTSPESK